MDSKDQLIASLVQALEDIKEHETSKGQTRRDNEVWTIARDALNSVKKKLKEFGNSEGRVDT